MIDPKKLYANLKEHLWAFVISLGVTAIGLFLYSQIYLAERPSPSLQFLDNIELRALDTRFKVRGVARPSPDVVIVGIDLKSQDRLGRWPFPRSHFARMIDNLKADGAKVVAFDIDFPKPDQSAALDTVREVRARYSAELRRGRGTTEFLRWLEQVEVESDNDRKFAESLARAGNVVLGHFFFFSGQDIGHLDRKSVEAYEEILSFGAYPVVRRVASRPGGPTNFPILFTQQGGPEAVMIEPNRRLFADAANYTMGFFNFHTDTDGTVRREPLVIKHKEDFYPPLDIQAIRMYLDLPDDQVAVVFNESGLERIQLGQINVLPDRAGRMLINYQGRAGTYKHYSMADVVEGTLPPETFKNKIVLVGATAIGIGDLRVTPFQTVDFPGVEIHANAIDTIITRRFLHHGDREELIDLILIAVFGIGVGIGLGRLRPLFASLLVVSVGGLFVLGGYWLFDRYGMWINMVIPGVTLLLNFAGVISYRMIFEEREKRFIRGVFAQCMSPAVIEEVVKDPEKLQLGGEERELSIMFSDIRGFTTISEKLTPTQLVELLNEYLTEMTDIVFRERGTLDKYIGDALMAFWGAPYEQADHAARACVTAIEMLKRLDALRIKWEQQRRPALNIGLGINTGLAKVGMMGSEKRKAYTAMGDSVNLASRLEGLNKEYSTRIIISENTYEYARNDFLVRELDLIRVKGKYKPVTIYELMDYAADGHERRDLAAAFNEGLAAYKSREWSRGIKIFEEILERYPEDGPSKIFLHRCQLYLEEEPEPAWDGVYVMKTK